MDAKQVFQQFRDMFTVRTVFGEPIDREGVTLVPVARVLGVGWSGEGEASHHRGQAEGEPLPTRGTGWGGAWGGDAHAIGAYVIRNGDVRWQPVLDANRVILGAQIAGIVVGAEIASMLAAVVFRSIVRRR